MKEIFPAVCEPFIESEFSQQGFNSVHCIMHLHIYKHLCFHYSLYFCKHMLNYYKRGCFYMVKVITLGLQKGGVSKTTTTGALSYLLSKEGYKTLAIDMDSQGNMTELLTGIESNEFIGQSIFEAIASKQPRQYIYTVNQHLDIIPANNFLASFARWIYTNQMPHMDRKVYYKGEIYDQLNQTLELVKNEYDFIIIDTPPALSEQTTNALVASDHVIILYESSKFCHSAVPNFIETVEFVQNNINNELKIMGILRTLNDKRRNDAKLFNMEIAEDYPDLVFNTVITRKATTGRLALYGFEENQELNDSLSQFEEFYKEFWERIRKSDGNE